MSENRSIYASPITWAIILILIIVLGITISSLFSFSDDLSSVQNMAEQSGTQQVGDRRTVVAVSNAQSNLEDDLEASDAAQQSAIGAVYSTQSALSNEAATEIANLQQMISSLSTSQAAVAADLGAASESSLATQMALNETFEGDAATQQTVVVELQGTLNALNATLESVTATQDALIFELQETQNALSGEIEGRETLVAETIDAMSTQQMSASEFQSTQAAYFEGAMTREAGLQATISVMQSTQTALLEQPSPIFTPTPTDVSPAVSGIPVLYVEGLSAVRAGPGTEFERLGFIQPDSALAYPILNVDHQTRFYQIEFDGQHVWISMGSRIRVEGDLSQLPTVEPAETPSPTPTPGS